MAGRRSPLAKTPKAAAKLLAVTVRSASSNVHLGRKGLPSLCHSLRTLSAHFILLEPAHFESGNQNSCSLDGVGARVAGKQGCH